MQAAPAVTVSAGPDRAATAALCLLSGLAVAVCGAWAMARGDTLGLSVFMTVSIVSALSLWSWIREPAVQLRWDGQRWWVVSFFDAAALPRSGQVAVAIDLGHWLLLRFRPDAASRWSLSQWLALGQSTQPRDWHLLRCALYSPRPPSLAQG